MATDWASIRARRDALIYLALSCGGVALVFVGVVLARRALRADSAVCGINATRYERCAARFIAFDGHAAGALSFFHRHHLMQSGAVLVSHTPAPSVVTAPEVAIVGSVTRQLNLRSLLARHTPKQLDRYSLASFQVESSAYCD